MKTLQYSALIASVILILPAVAFAENTSPKMQSAMNKVTCDTMMLAGIVNDVTVKIPSASTLNQNINSINSDMQKLQGYAKSDDQTNFNTFLKETYQKDAKTLRRAVNDLIKSSTVDKSVKNDLKTAIDLRQSENQKCISGVLKTIADAKNQKSPNQIPTKDKTKAASSTVPKMKNKPNQK
ncbi:MAG TPA: hypothetical protein VLF17_01010 [Candidatus Nitrosotenuis sp.]|nr:hypothetical protein [Candidatus Nitrosotenuis sp.]